MFSRHVIALLVVAVTAARYREYRRHVRRFIPRVRPWSAT